MKEVQCNCLVYASMYVYTCVNMYVRMYVYMHAWMDVENA